MPPLGAVRAFEAAVRHMSFTGAARELLVSPSAVSQQIKALEQHLGVELFQRDRARGLSLTPAGRLCAPALQPMFDSLSHLFEQVRAEPGDRAVTLIASPSLLWSWLPTRLAQFHERCPDITVRMWVNRGMQPSENTVEHDLAIYFGDGPFQDLRGDLLMMDTVFPVCSPGLLSRRPLRTPADLGEHTLIHDDTMIWSRTSAAMAYPDWSSWFAVAGVSGVPVSRGLRVQGSGAVMEAAAEGVGVALARSCIAARYLASGRLVRPFAIEYPRRFPYYLACKPEALSRLGVAQLHAFLLEQGHEMMRTAGVTTAA